MNSPSRPSILRLFSLRRALVLGAALIGLGLGACDSKSLGQETCKDGEVKQVDCNTCTCTAGEWACTEKACDAYDPCEDKSCGEGCTACDPNDPDCVEDQVLKACNGEGLCVADDGLLCGAPYEPCAGKGCGDLCTVCDPNDPDCIETEEVKACDAFGMCTGNPPVCEPACVEGEMKQVECNTCVCSGGAWACDDQECPTYEPCLGKACGDGCQLCDPNDPECVEDDVIKACDPDGVCVAETPDLCEGAYVPCEGKACGDMCTICAPDDLECAEDSVIKACNTDGECVPDTMDLCL